MRAYTTQDTCTVDCNNNNLPTTLYVKRKQYASKAMIQISPQTNNLSIQCLLKPENKSSIAWTIKKVVINNTTPQLIHTSNTKSINIDTSNETSPKWIGGEYRVNLNVTPLNKLSSPIKPHRILNCLVSPAGCLVVASAKTIKAWYDEHLNDALKEGFLLFLEATSMHMKAFLDNHPKYHYMSVDITISPFDILDLLQKKGIETVATITQWGKKIAKILNFGVTFEINVDRYGRVYIGLGGEAGAGFRNLRKGEKKAKKVTKINGEDISSKVIRITEIGGEEISASIIQNFDNEDSWKPTFSGKPTWGSPKDRIENFLTGGEANTSFNLIGLFVGGYTYSATPEKISKEVGIGTNPTSFEMSLYISFEVNYSWCLDCN